MNKILTKIKHHRRSSQSNGIKSSNDFIIESIDNHPSSSSSPTSTIIPTSPSFTTSRLQLLDNDPPNPSNKNTRLSSTSDSLQQDIGSSSSAFHDDLLRRPCHTARSLRGTLSDPTALGYFLTFMETLNLRHLVKFWLDAETFRVSTLATLDRLAKNSNCPSSDMNIVQMIEKDAVAIFAKYLSKESSNSIGVTDSLRDFTINKICGEEGRLNPECFNQAQDFILKIMQTRYYPEYVKSLHYCKHLIEVLSQENSTVSITDILFDETALFYFIEFMESERQRTLVEFWMSAQNFRQKYENGAGKNKIDSQEDAMTIYNKYLSLQCHNRLTVLDDRLRICVENEICSIDGQPSINCFEPLCHRVLLHLDQHYLPKFLKSKLFAKFYKELVNTASSDLDLPAANRRKPARGSSAGCSSSDCSYQNYSTTMSSELMFKAGCQKSHRLSQTEHSDSSSLSSHTVDTKMFDDDPDSLWKRDKQKLTLGHVDQVGRYISESQRLQCSNKPKTGKKIKEKVKKAVFGDTECDAILAEQVAAMILQDVQQMTQASGELQ